MVRTPVAVTAALVVSLYLAPLLLDTPLTDPDEGLHASISQEMRDRGELIVPRFLGRPFLDKPVLYFWTQIASMSMLGETAPAIRLPGLVFAILGIATTGWLAQALFGRTAGWLAAACYATTAVPFALAQAPVHDVALVPMANVALLAFWRLMDADNQRAAALRPRAAPSALRDAGYVLLAGSMLGLSALTKGLSAISIVGVTMAATLLVTRRLTLRLALQGAAALVIAVAVAAPWYLAVESRQPGYLHYYFVSRHLLGFATDTQRHGDQPWWYYLPILGAGGVPWIIYAVRLKAGRLNAHAPDLVQMKANATQVLLWSWTLGSLVMLTVAGSKLVTYILPAFPPIAVLAARHWAVAIDGSGASIDLKKRATAHCLLFAVVGALLPLVLGTAGGTGTSWPMTVVFLGTSAIWLVLASRIARAPASWIWPRAALGTGVTYAAALILAGPALAEANSARSLAERLNQMPRLPGSLVVVGERIGSVVFYLRPDLRRQIDAGRVRQVNATDVAEVVRPGDVVAISRDRLTGLGAAAAAWEPYRTTAGRYVVFGPLP